MSKMFHNKDEFVARCKLLGQICECIPEETVEAIWKSLPTEVVGKIEKLAAEEKRIFDVATSGSSDLSDLPQDSHAGVNYLRTKIANAIVKIVCDTD